MPTIQYPNHPNTDTAFVVQDDGTKNRALMTAPQDTSTLELPKNANSCKGYVTINGKKQRVVMTVDATGGSGGSVDYSKTVQKTSTMPTADASNVGQVYLYTGNTDSNYTQNYIYKNVKTALYTGTVSFEAATISGTTVACSGDNFANFLTESGVEPLSVVSGTMTYDVAGDLWILEGKDSSGNTVLTFQEYQQDFVDAGFTFTGTPSNGDVIAFTCTVEEVSTSYAWTRIDVQPSGGSWGSIKGDINNQKDLTDILEQKQSILTIEGQDRISVKNTIRTHVPGYAPVKRIYTVSAHSGIKTGIKIPTGETNFYLYMTFSPSSERQWSLFQAAENSAEPYGIVGDDSGTIEFRWKGETICKSTVKRTGGHRYSLELYLNNGQANLITTDLDSEKIDEAHGIYDPIAPEIEFYLFEPPYGLRSSQGGTSIEHAAIDYNDELSLDLWPYIKSDTVSDGVLYSQATGQFYTKDFGSIYGNTAQGLENFAIQYVPEIINTTLLLSNWSNNEQTIHVPGMLASSVVLVNPEPSSQADYINAGIFCTAQTYGKLTFKCDNVPTSDIPIVLVRL